MARKAKTHEQDTQLGLFDLTLYLKTAPCVPALRKLVTDWRDAGYKGVTRTTRTLLNFWFSADHPLPNRQLFKYHTAQREAIETLIYVYEVAKIRSRKDLLEHYAPANSQVRLPAYDEFARFCTKMATGSGKTKVMSLAIIWHYFNAVRESEDYYAKLIATNLKLPSQFNALAPKVWDFFAHHAFGETVDMYSPTIIQAMNHRVAGYVVLDVFGRALKDKIIEQLEPTIEGEERKLSAMEPFAFSRSVLEARKCVFNLVPCDNDFEYAFAKFLESAKDVVAFAKLPQQFGFSIEYTDNNANLRYYYPDFVVKTDADEMWLVETKGQESLEVAYKDRAAQLWCENATRLTGEQWRYMKVPQKEYMKLQPVEFYDLLAFVS